MNQQNETNRRNALKTGLSATVAVAGIGAGNQTEDQSSPQNPLFQPEDFWQERMVPPDDGKRLGWFVDTRRCFGCHACEVSCKAENDVPLGHYIRQTFTKDVGKYPKVARMFLPMACQHCEDAPCIKACPCGALDKGVGGSVLVDYESCCGHGTCVDVCPYGAIYLDPVAKQAVKCHNCYHRLEHDLEPACVPTCPANALHFGDLNDEESPIRLAMKNAEKEQGELTQMRPDKQTKPRTWFAGSSPVELEGRVPTEGQSYSPDAYNIHGWKDDSNSETRPKN